jgi:Peptidase family M28
MSLLSYPFTYCQVLSILLLAPGLAEAALIEIQAVPGETIEQRLRRFSKSNWTRERELRKLFEEAGCGADQVSEQSVTPKDPPNVACRLPGTTDSTIIVGAHSDLRGGGQGVLDDWSGAALLASLFLTLQTAFRQHTFIFVGFTGEEHHMEGSRFYVRQLSAEQAVKIRAMVNLDCIGAGSTAVWTRHADPKLLAILYQVAREERSVIRNVDLVRMYDDAVQFRKRGIPTVSIHSLTGTTLHVLHSRRDNLSVIDPDQYEATYRLIAGYLARLDLALE